MRKLELLEEEVGVLSHTEVREERSRYPAHSDLIAPERRKKALDAIPPPSLESAELDELLREVESICTSFPKLGSVSAQLAVQKMQTLLWEIQKRIDP